MSYCKLNQEPLHAKAVNFHLHTNQSSEYKGVQTFAGEAHLQHENLVHLPSQTVTEYSQIILV